MHRWSRVFVWVACVTTTYGCARNPATGRPQLSLISESQEVAMGRESAAEISRTLGLVDDRALQSYVSDIGQRLAADSERPELPWEFHVVDDPVANAFALPGGFIYVTRGMLALMTSEAQLASVLGHEIGHVTARHSVNQISKQQLAQLGLGLGAVLVPEVRPLQSLLGTGLGLLFLKFSRDDEREADQLGFRYINDHRYAVSEFAEVFRALDRSATRDEGAIPGWLTTHPAPDERVRSAEERTRATPPQADARVARDVFLRRIDDLVYGADPRDGFFRDGIFFHPRLRFQITFPSGWETANLTQAVVAAAPQNRAVMQLTIAGNGDPEQSLVAFFRDAGVRPGRTARTTVSGQPAALGEFEAQTEQGSIAGIVGFLSFRQQTYQVVGYTSGDQYSRHAGQFERVFRSFEPVTSQSVLAVRPQRIDIVQLPRPTTVEELRRQSASDVSVDQLALINQLPGADARIEAGTLVKQIVGPALAGRSAAR